MAVALALAAAGCGKPAPKPADADVAAYLGQGQPTYVRVGQVATSFEPMRQLGGTALPEGSWRIKVSFVLHAGQDLFAPVPEAAAQRAAFDRAVAGVEEFRLPRIAAVEQLGRSAGLMKEGAKAPEPAVPVSVVAHKDQDLPDQVTLLAEPDGHGWKFVQLDAQSLSDDAIGAPLDELRRQSPSTVFVEAGSPEARAYAERARRFLEVLSKAPKL